MKIIPAIDIKDGQCAQLIGGVAETAKYYGDPLDAAEKWAALGADVLHIVDLDAALGTGSNLDSVLAIKDALDVEINFGGGVRDYAYCMKLLDEYEIDRVAIGTLALKDYKRKIDGKRMQIEDIPVNLRERIIVSIDSKDGNVVTCGWTNKTGVEASKVASCLQPLVWGFLYTDVDVEGQMKGINLERTKEIIRSTKKPVIASGGISSIEDAKNLKAAGAWGVVLGKALYEGLVDLQDLQRI